MKKRLLLLATWLVGASALGAQNASDVVVPITVTTNASPASITLSFPAAPTDTVTFIGRKLINQTQWSAIALPGNATSFTDNNIVAGIGFEYIVLKQGNAVPGQRIGLVYAGVEVLPTFYRGKMILVVDDVLSSSLNMELDRLVQDLRGDGWQVLRHDINVATSTVTSVKTLIRNDFQSDPDNVTAALLFGNIPVPYSGNIAPDGHSEHQGAWPTDYYYGDMDEAAWTDNLINNNTAARVANRNVPGDGKFDQSQTPTLAEIVVSRVDFSNLTTGWGVSQTELYRRYLDKNHAFRTGTYKPSNETLVDDNFGYFGGEAFSQNGYRNGYVLTGANSVKQLDFFADTKNQSFLLGHGCGAGGYSSAAGVGTSTNFQTDSVNIVFSMLFGSYFGDWDFETNPLMPSALASKGGILTCTWAGRPNWHLHHMGLGEPILTSTYWVWLNSFLQAPVYPSGFGDDLVHVGLLGDPTLRAHALRPPQNVVATPSCETINLAWDASPDAQFGYLVYWAPDPDSIYQIIIPSPVFGTTFIDSFPADGENYYMVRALKLEAVPSGSYFNQSTGIGASATFGADPFSAEAFVTHIACNGNDNGSVTLVVTGGQNLSYAWSNGATTADVNDLSAGEYAVTISDASGCTATLEATIDEPEELGISASITNATCFGAADGGIALAVSGGVLPYSFEWSNGDTTQDLNDLGAGVYSGTLTDGNGCLAIITDEVTEPSELELTLTAADADCNGAATGSILSSISGGVPGYDFAWSNNSDSENLDNVPAGTYTVIVTDANGCTAEAGATIAEPDAITAEAVTSDAGCAGAATGSVELTVGGGTPGYTFEWSNSSTEQNLTDVASGTYTVTITDATGCTQTLAATVDQATSLEVETSSTSVLCFGETGGSASVQATGGTPDYVYQWSNSGATESIDGLAAGTYTVTVTDDAGCSQTATVSVGQPTEIGGAAEWVAETCSTDIGTVTLTVSGGTPGYTFEWSTSDDTQNLENIAPDAYTVTITDANGCTTTITNTIVQPPAPLSAQTVFEQTSCPGGEVFVTLYCFVFGGTPGFDYAWSNGVSSPTAENSPVGTYTVTVTDANGCTTEATVTAEAEIDEWEVTVADIAEASCFGSTDGAISISVSGATGPNYSYDWSNSATTKDLTNIAAGTYTVTITDSAGCTTTETVSVGQPEQLVASVGTSADVSCAGLSDGQATITAGGGTPGYTYFWQDGTTAPTNTNLSAGTIGFGVTDANGCTAVGSVTIGSPDPITANVIVAHVTCPGLSDGQATVTANGGTPGYTYVWSNNATGAQLTGLPAGTITGTITDANGCTSTVTATINEPVPPVVSIVGSVDTACVGGSLLFSLPAVLGNFQWSVSGNGTIAQGQGTAQVEVAWQTTGTATVTGAYTWSANNCPGTASVDVEVVICVSTHEPTLAGVRVLPNPFGPRLNVLFDRPAAPGTRLRLLDLQGRLLYEQGSLTETTEVQTEQLPAGAYFLQIVENGRVGVWKVIKTE